MASGRDRASPHRSPLSFGQIARIAGWAPTPFVGFGHGCYASRRFPILQVRNQRDAAAVCGGLNHRFADNLSLSPRFAWLPASGFPRHERLNIEVSIQEAQRGELHGEAAEAVHLLARQAMTFAEILPKSRAGKACYVFFRSFPGLKEPCPLEHFAVLPDEEVEAAMEAEGQRWAGKNRKLIIERLRKQSARRTGSPPRRPKPRISLDDLIEESDKVFSEAMELPRKDQQDEEPDKPTVVSRATVQAPTTSPKADEVESHTLTSAEPPATNKQKRPCYDRDCEIEALVAEAESKGVKYKWARARDEFNKKHPDSKDHISKGRSGRDLVREATRKIRAEREEK